MGIFLQITQTGVQLTDTIAGSAGQIPNEVTLSIWELSQKGGWIMAILGVFSIIAIYIFIERFFAINKASKEEYNFMNNIRDFIHEGRIDSAVSLSKNNTTPIARMIEKGLSRIGKPLNDINAAIENTGILPGSKLEKNIAAFPDELAYRIIKLFSYVGETVLDPFLGSGTSILAAKNIGRNSVGYEINSEFIPFIKKKLQVNQSELFGAKYNFITQDVIDTDFDQEINNLPYIFKDFHNFDKKIDPKKLQFGSKIDKNSNHREEYFSVKKIISPQLLLLSNGLTVRLIGIREDPMLNGDAIEFLKIKTKNQKVYMRFDSEKHDSDNNLFCYLYLKNKTFLNAHLIKKGLARVDEQTEYKYKNKFLNLRKP